MLILVSGTFLQSYQHTENNWINCHSIVPVKTTILITLYGRCRAYPLYKTRHEQVSQDS